MRLDFGWHYMQNIYQVKIEIFCINFYNIKDWHRWGSLKKVNNSRSISYTLMKDRKDVI